MGFGNFNSHRQKEKNKSKSIIEKTTGKYSNLEDAVKLLYTENKLNINMRPSQEAEVPSKRLF